ncbi:serine hydrolase family protein [Candidatus Peregrinibacteria bacterium]|nr:serine hydrolase family protein [Candidatus Peregrinibacteria bacterium]
MSTVFIFHGIYGTPQENWFPWMKGELEKSGHRVIVPAFPNFDRPILDEWMRHIEKYEKDVDSETTFVGHSLGAAFALRLIGRMHQHIYACYLASPVWEVMGNEFDPLMKGFTEAPYDWNVIRKYCDRFTVLHGGDDPYIRHEKSAALAVHLGIDLVEIPRGGHLNTAAGYRQFPLLRDLILSEITS